jgi:hypothetical protein
MTAASAARVTSPTELEAFELRCWARARLYAHGELDLHAAIDELQAHAERRGLVADIGQDDVQACMAAAFGPVRAAELTL